MPLVQQRRSERQQQRALSDSLSLSQQLMHQQSRCHAASRHHLHRWCSHQFSQNLPQLFPAALEFPGGNGKSFPTSGGARSMSGARSITRSEFAPRVQTSPEQTLPLVCGALAGLLAQAQRLSLARMISVAIFESCTLQLTDVVVKSLTDRPYHAMCALPWLLQMRASLGPRDCGEDERIFRCIVTILRKRSQRVDWYIRATRPGM